MTVINQAIEFHSVDISPRLATCGTSPNHFDLLLFPSPPPLPPSPQSCRPHARPNPIVPPGSWRVMRGDGEKKRRLSRIFDRPQFVSVTERNEMTVVGSADRMSFVKRRAATLDFCCSSNALIKRRRRPRRLIYCER